MKKLIIVFMVFVLVLLMFPAVTYAGAKNATYLEWTWPKDIHKSGYFMKTGSGIVQGWTYDHPDFGDARFIYKPVDKFKNAAEAGCDEGCLMQVTDWKAINLRNVMDTVAYQEAFDEIFLYEEYVLCIYDM